MSVVGWMDDHKIWLIKILYTFYAKLNIFLKILLQRPSPYSKEVDFKWVFEKLVFITNPLLLNKYGLIAVLFSESKFILTLDFLKSGAVHKLRLQAKGKWIDSL